MLGGVNSHSKTHSPAPAEQGTYGGGRAGLHCLKMSVNPPVRAADQKLAGAGAGSTHKGCSAYHNRGFVQVWSVAITQMGTRNNEDSRVAAAEVLHPSFEFHLHGTLSPSVAQKLVQLPIKASSSQARAAFQSDPHLCLFLCHQFTGALLTFVRKMQFQKET